jgi:hypothetical protein
MVSRLAGHGLIQEGWPFIGTHLQARYRSGPGMAKCECGSMSDVLPSASARKRWHRQHKEDLLRLMGLAGKTAKP